MRFLNPDTDLSKIAAQHKVAYQTAEPFSNIVLDNFLDEETLHTVLDEFPDLSRSSAVNRFDNHNEKKYGGRGEQVFGPHTRALMHFMNSEPIIRFLQELTGIRETLIPDPYFVGGGCHEIKSGGLLKVHADFNKHEMTGLDRRVNLIIYLNEDWKEAYGGHFELWNKDMTICKKKVLPLFNRVAIFSTTDFSYHGHPDPLTCPPERSRKSLALYYYSNGRPDEEINKGLEQHSTLFVGRRDVKQDVKQLRRPLKTVLLDFVPPILIKLIKK